MVLNQLKSFKNLSRAQLKLKREMKAATVKELKTALSNQDKEELITICLRLSRFKKENKELLTYLLYESENEINYINSVKRAIDDEFDKVNRKSYYFIKKSVRKILKTAKKYIRYSQKNESEVEILIYFCQKLKEFKPTIEKNIVLRNIYVRQLESIKNTIKHLHEDLQYDYLEKMEELNFQ